MSSVTCADAEAEAGRRAPWPYPLVSGLASGLLLWLAFPPANQGWLAWFALAPLFGLIVRPGARLALYGGAWLGGAAFWLLAIQWVRLADSGAWLGWVTMALVLSLWWPVFLALGRLAVGRLRLPLMIAAPILWVGLEFVRAYSFTGFPWYYLAHSQHRVLPLIQSADFAGALGLSFLIAGVNAAWVDLHTLPWLSTPLQRLRLPRSLTIRLGVLAVLLASNVAYGTYRLASAQFRPGPRLALIQSSLIQRYKLKADAAQLLAIYQQLVDRAAEATPRPDLIIWPETAYPYGFVAIDPELSQADFARQSRQLSSQMTPEDWWNKMQGVSDQLHAWTDRLDVAMLIGTLTYNFHRDGAAKYNSALLLEPGKTTVQSYHKLHLVPFGEYVPLIATFPWLTALTPYHGADAVVPKLSFGPAPAWFQLGPYQFAAAICFEDTVPQVVRRFFERPADRQPDILLNLSNDGWFHGSEELDMHLAVSIFRAVENRVPLARAVNTGISAIIDGNGRILAALPRLEAGILAQTIPLDDRISLYSTWGDWLGIFCLTASILLLPWATVQGILARKPAPAGNFSHPGTV
jgi:apolipoprotein N-acyltransferase